MPDWIIAIIDAVIPTLSVGLLLAAWNARQKKREKIAEQKEEIAREAESLKLSLLVATAELSYSIAMAIKRGSANGEVEAAIIKYNAAMEEFREFERKRMSTIWG